MLRLAMTFSITLLYAGVLGVLMAVLSIRVPMRRGALDAPWGDAGDESLRTRIRAFGNFTEYVPMVLLLMALLEVSGASRPSLHVVGGGLLTARFVHAVMYRGRECLTLPEKVGRATGAMLTWLALIGSAVYAVVLAVGA